VGLSGIGFYCDASRLPDCHFINGDPAFFMGFYFYFYRTTGETMKFVTFVAENEVHKIGVLMESDRNFLL
jgi:hypothetical protein